MTEGFRSCSSCSREDCEDEGVCVWSWGKCGTNIDTAFLEELTHILEMKEEMLLALGEIVDEVAMLG